MEARESCRSLDRRRGLVVRCIIGVLFICLVPIVAGQPQSNEQINFVSNNGSTQTGHNHTVPYQPPTTSPSPPVAASGKTRPLLPTNVRPSRYILTIDVNFDTVSFSGQETIEIEVVETTRSIEIHAVMLNITEAVFRLGGSSQPFNAHNISYDASRHTAILDFGASLPVTKKALLDIRFNGNLAMNMDGLYLSQEIYTDSKGEKQKRNIAVTQFEPVAARKAFPCWDEPAIKAIFEVTLKVPHGYTAISNMPVNSFKNSSEGLSFSFDPSPIMSTYLLAFVVGEFEHVEGETKEGVNIKVYTPPTKKHLGTFALDAGVGALSYFTDYFGIPYPLPKLDMVAIPDFSAGAMENWGCVTYREALLLIDQKASALATKEAVAYVVSHELAHQWFGNLVTMEWWTDLWLNEGFATWVGNLAVDHLFPDWDIWTQFTAQYFREGLAVDGLANSHPIEVEVGSPGEIGEIFDTISYNKGAAVIRMLANYLGLDTFKQSLRVYLNRHTYKNARTMDLWAATSEVSKKPINSLMHSWIKETGYPLVSLDLSETTGAITVTQSRFLVSQDSQQQQQQTTTTTTTTWWLPLMLTTSATADSEEPIRCSLFEGGNSSVKQEVIEGTVIGWDSLKNDADWWIKANSFQTGFFRVKYSSSLLQRLGIALQRKKLHASDRLGLIDDAFALSVSGHERTWNALELVLHYCHEEDYTVWSTIADNLRSVLNVWKQHSPELARALEVYVHHLLEPTYNRLGWEAKPGEDTLVTLLRGTVIGLLVRTRHTAATEEARRRFEAATDGSGSDLPADLRSAVYEAVLSSGQESGYEAIIKRYRDATLEEERMRSLHALGKSTDQKLVLRALEFAMSEEVRSQDTFRVFISVSDNSAAGSILWEFFKDNWARLWGRYSVNPNLLGRMIMAATNSFASEEQAKELEAFFSGKEIPGVERTIRQVLEKTRNRARWLQRDGDGMQTWLLETFLMNRERWNC